MSRRRKNGNSKQQGGKEAIFHLFDGLVFYLPKFSGRAAIVEKIVKHGGAVVPKPSPNAVNLVPPALVERMSNKDLSNVVLVDYVTDCIQTNEVKNMDSYRAKRANVGPSPSKRAAYTTEEDAALYKFVKETVATDPSLSETGLKLWKMAVDRKVTCHSAQSMRTHYLRYVAETHDAVTGSPMKQPPTAKRQTPKSAKSVASRKSSSKKQTKSPLSKTTTTPSGKHQSQSRTSTPATSRNEHVQPTSSSRPNSAIQLKASKIIQASVDVQESNKVLDTQQDESGSDEEHLEIEMTQVETLNSSSYAAEVELEQTQMELPTTTASQTKAKVGPASSKTFTPTEDEAISRSSSKSSAVSQNTGNNHSSPSTKRKGSPTKEVPAKKRKTAAELAEEVLSEMAHQLMRHLGVSLEAAVHAILVHPQKLNTAQYLQHFLKPEYRLKYVHTRVVTSARIDKAKQYLSGTADKVEFWTAAEDVLISQPEIPKEQVEESIPLKSYRGISQTMRKEQQELVKRKGFKECAQRRQFLGLQSDYVN